MLFSVTSCSAHSEGTTDFILVILEMTVAKVTANPASCARGPNQDQLPQGKNKLAIVHKVRTATVDLLIFRIELGAA